MNAEEQSAKTWWFHSRWRYNKGLFIAGFIAFLLYNILGPIIIDPIEEFDETGVLMIVHLIAYFIGMCVANVFYTLGYLVDVVLNPTNSVSFREDLFRLGYWFSVSLPILLVAFIMLSFLFRNH
jgi:MFS family permease